MVALVTGHAGFLGGHVCAALRERGWTVHGAGRPEMEVPSPAFDALLAHTRPGLVVHCAGPASVAVSVENPAADHRGSVGVLVDVLERIRALPAPRPRLVLLSSAAVYGQPERLPVREDAPLAPVSPYGFHRVAAELALREFAELYGLRTLALRVFSAYGEGLRRQIVWDICAKALRDGDVRLEGTGDESRDFVHAADVAAAVAVAAERGGFEGEAYNVAAGRETTIRELASLLLAELGAGTAVHFSGRRRPGDPCNWRADLSRIGALGFRPAVSLEDGVRRYAAWARRELERG